nr:hypothetical protein Iba_scaffold3818CG0030 [Ipomoea batatas]
MAVDRDATQWSLQKPSPLAPLRYLKIDEEISSFRRGFPIVHVLDLKKLLSFSILNVVDDECGEQTETAAPFARAVAKVPGLMKETRSRALSSLYRESAFCNYVTPYDIHGFGKREHISGVKAMMREPHQAWNRGTSDWNIVISGTLDETQTT